MGFKEGETIRINVKPKPTTNGTGMLSAALSGTGKPKPLALAPPPKAAGITRSPLPPPPNDPVASRIASDGCKESIDNTRRRNEPLSDLSQLKVNKPCLINWIYSSLKLRLVILDLVGVLCRRISLQQRDQDRPSQQELHQVGQLSDQWSVKFKFLDKSGFIFL